MPIHNLVYLSRNDYISSIQAITDAKTLKFADMTLKWWDKKFGWYIKGCAVLTDANNSHLCYIFYKIDKYNEYITIHNIFTPLAKRRNGYANTLLGLIFDLAISENVNRFRLTSISKSLDFYLALGFIYWGVNSVGDYYCDLPIPFDGLIGLDIMIKKNDISTLLGKKLDKIYAKIENNSTNLSDSQTTIYDNDVMKMGSNYLLNKLINIKYNKLLTT